MEVLERVQIIDDDVDFNELLPENLQNTLEEDVGDNDPIVAGIIDERPEEVKRMEEYRESGKWKTLLHDNKHERHDSDSDQSPNKHNSDSDQPVDTNQRRHDSDSDQSPPKRQKRHDSDSDQSPPRKQKRHDSDSDQSPHRKQKRHDSDSDQSPPRRRKRHDSGSDQSPPRKPAKRNSDSDQSPPRRQKRHDSGSDQSPPRRQRQSEKKSIKAEEKMSKTLSGKIAGLSSARDMKREAEKLKDKENAMFSKIDDDTLGRNSTTVFRDKSGKRRNLKEEKRLQKADERKKVEEEEKYMEWGKGLKQKAEQEQTIEEHLHEMSKPLARYKDDTDLDKMLKEQARDGDPMLAYLKKKKSGATKGGQIKEKPRYRGPTPAPNRYGIMPGYRWDGVDRSNGFEKQFFMKQANRKAVATEAFQWSTEDM